MNYVFVVGFERCGTHSMADILRASVKVPAFVKHEEFPYLCKEASDFVRGGTWESPDLQERIARYRQIGKCVRLVCECNHRLSFFIQYLQEKFPESKFILMVRDPVKTIISRVATLAHWPEIIDHRYPDFFQEKVAWVVPQGKEVFNIYRPKPPDFSRPLHELYLWEWIETYRHAVLQLSAAKRVMVVETNSTAKSIGKVLDFINPSFFDRAKAIAAASIRSDSIYDDPNKADLIQYATELIEPHANWIREQIASKFPNDPIVARILRQ